MTRQDEAALKSMRIGVSGQNTLPGLDEFSVTTIKPADTRHAPIYDWSEICMGMLDTWDD